MDYVLNKIQGDTLAVPQIVVSKICEIDENTLRVALYLLSNGISGLNSICYDLNISNENLERALMYWQGAGLISKNNDKNTSNIPVKKAGTAPRLTTKEIIKHSQTDSNISALISECQGILGETISENETRILVSLYLSDGMPIDLILTGVSHFASQGKRSARYIAKALISWQTQGITTCLEAENYLLLEKNRELKEKDVADILGIIDHKFLSVEKKCIRQWYELFNFNDEIIREANIYAGDKNTIKYIHGILKNWHNKGYKSIRDIRINENGSNIRTTPQKAKIKADSKIMQRNIGREIDFGKED